MEKVLFITTRNILTTSGELRLIKNRSIALSQFHGVNTDYFVIRKDSTNIVMEDSSLNIIQIHNIKFTSVLKEYFSIKNEIKKLIQSGEYGAVIFSGVGTLHFVKFLRKHNYIGEITLDIHGSSKDIIEYAKGKRLFKKIFLNLIYHYENYLYKTNLNRVDSFFVVSNALKNNLVKKYKIKDKSMFFVIPCSIDNFNIDERTIYTNRNKVRKKYNIKESEILFIYSGGVSKWQCITETVDLFHKINNTIQMPVKMLMLSHNLTDLKKKVSSSKNIIFDSLKHNEVYEVLCSADYAFLIRDNIETNHLAFPNKFLEYVSAGLKVITTAFIFDVSEIVKNNQIGVVIDHKNPDYVLLNDYLITNYKHRDITQHKKILNETSFENTLNGYYKHIKSRGIL